MNSHTFDFAVIGLGAVGAATLWQLSKSGKKVVGFDQFSPPHQMGSSHGETRITRVAVGEGMNFVPLVKRSHEIWGEIEKKTGKKILHQVGGLLFESKDQKWSKHGSQGFFDRTLNFAHQAAIPFEIWEGKELHHKYPEFNHQLIERAYFEPGAGYLYPELAIETQLQLAQQNNASIKTHVKILSIRPLTGGGVSITTNQGNFEASQVILSAGAWIKDFIPSFWKPYFKICRQVLYWISTANAQAYRHTPIFMWGFGQNAEDFIYGFPSLDGKTIKIASENFKESHHPDTLSREVQEEEKERFIQEKISDRLFLLKNDIPKTAVCQYTVTPDANFVIDRLPDFPEVIVASTCSGHGFKHSAAIGEALAKKAMNEHPTIDLTSFQMNYD
jgi:sarcosine oxidase